MWFLQRGDQRQAGSDVQDARRRPAFGSDHGRTDVSRTYEINSEIPPFTAAPDDGTPWRIQQVDIDRLFEFRKCIECFLCQDVCHVNRSHGLAERFYGPRYFVRVAGLEMHPKDVLDRTEQTRAEGGLGYCNITKCCTEVCPEHIHITDNAIIPLKERVADQYYDPLRKLVRLMRGKKSMRPENERPKSGGAR